jgi:hypothetical protein
VGATLNEGLVKKMERSFAMKIREMMTTDIKKANPGQYTRRYCGDDA